MTHATDDDVTSRTTLEFKLEIFLMRVPLDGVTYRLAGNLCASLCLTN